MDQQFSFTREDKVKFTFKGQLIYGIVNKVNRKTITVKTRLRSFRVTPGALIHVNEPEWNLNINTEIPKPKESDHLSQKTKVFKIGDQIRFRYKGKSYSGTVKKINRKTITIQGELGRFRAHPNRLSHLESPMKAKSKLKQTRGRKWTEAQKSDYNVSNTSSIEPVPDDLLLQVQLIIKRLAAALAESNDNEINQSSNELVSNLTSLYHLPKIKIHTGGKRIANQNRQILGVHRTRDQGKKTQRSSISVFSRTAKRQQYVKPKTFLRTLVHEFIHHFDRYELKLGHEYHTKGFYQRVTTIYNQLKTLIYS
ncbi:MAG: hypothetical protein ACW97X_00705 [Candidatus Hodarchaeales archaeon]|jgi:hypothetical protein